MSDDLDSGPFNGIIVVIIAALIIGGIGIWVFWPFVNTSIPTPIPVPTPVPGPVIALVDVNFTVGDGNITYVFAVWNGLPDRYNVSVGLLINGVVANTSDSLVMTNTSVPGILSASLPGDSSNIALSILSARVQ